MQLFDNLNQMVFVKGGIVVAISSQLDLPVRFIGVGEGVADLRPFDADEFVAALFANN
mgnify:CR=1 FL=1